MMHISTRGVLGEFLWNLPPSGSANLTLAGGIFQDSFDLDDVWVPISQRTWYLSFLAERELQLMWYKLPLQCTSSSVGEYGNYGSQLYFP